MITVSGSAAVGNLGGSAKIQDTTPGTPTSVQLYIDAYFDDTVTFSGVGTVTCPATPGLADCPVGNVMTIPADQSLNVVMVYQLNGSWAYSDINYADIDPATQVDLAGNTLLDDTSNYENCPPVPCPATNSGTISSTLVTTTFSLGDAGSGSAYTIGQGYFLFTEFYDQLNCNTDGFCEGDFPDPALIDVEITDPSNGLPVNGITLTGDNGFVYPVNQILPTPEPGGIGYLALAAVLFGVLRRRRYLMATALGGEAMPPSTFSGAETTMNS